MHFESERIVWYNFLSISDEFLDGEHKKLILHLNDLSSMAERRPCDLARIRNGLQEFVESLSAHNRFEDGAYVELSPDDGVQSSAARVAFEHGSRQLVLDFGDSPSAHHAGRCVTALYLDLIEQILSHDMKMKTYFEKRLGH